MSERKARDFKNLTPEQQSSYEEQDLSKKLGTSGINNQGLLEPVPKFNEAACEKVIKGDNNNWIVLGRDRPAGLDSGYGGLGNTGAGSIDLVVGRMAGTTQGPDANIKASPNFFSDAARIYISQTTDIDTNFGLCGNMQTTTRSGVGIKADAVRVVGREGVKIVTGRAQNISGGGSNGEKNSQGGSIETVSGIQLIAGNDVEGDNKLEPIVKAYALNETLLQIVEKIKDLTNIVNELAKTQTQINRAITEHTHEAPQAPTGVLKTTPPVDLAITISTKEANKMSNVHQNIAKHKNNLKVGLVSDHLSPDGDKWFGSRYNKTN